MRYLSLFSGIEAASVAWKPLGWECAAVAEIEPFPCAVLAHHYPDVPNLGDVSRIGPEDIAALGCIDLVVFGSPCQDLSVAGKRRGLAGERSGLFHVAMDIVRWAREFSGCRWALWENVPGAFSSNKGRDFAAVVEQMAGLDDCPVPPKGWGTEGAAVGDEAMVEWAVLDAQWFGVAQRRRRVFALADFGDWANRPPVLLEPQSLRGDTAPSRTPGQGTAADAAPSPAASGRGVERTGESRGQDPVVAWPAEIASTLNAHFGAKQGLEDQHALHGAPLFVPHPITLAERGRDGGVSLEWRQDGTSNAILTPSGGRGGMGVGAVAFQQNTRDEVRLMGGDGQIAGALAANLGMKQQNYVAGAVCATGEVFHTLRADGFDASEDGTGRGGGGAIAFHANAQADQLPSTGRDTSVTDSLTCPQSAAVATAMQVRRLTPTECERLQGFPDGYTAIPVVKRNRHGNPTRIRMAADGPRYKALGNSMAVPVMRWIGQRIDLAASDLV